MKTINRLTFLLLATLLTHSAFAATGVELANYLGTGSNPHLYLDLSANGLNWQPYSIDYQQQGLIPCSTDTTNNWSAWDVKDENGNYYGTINLTCTNQTANFTGYSAGKNNNNYLTGVHFTFNKTVNAYQLTVDQIHSGSGIGPFPNAPLATPAIDPVTKTPITFHVSGTHILDNENRPVILKGVVRPSLEWNAQGQLLSPTDIQNMQKWGANVVRLDLNQNYWFASGPVTEQGSYKQIINAIVYYAIQNHMVVILDLHWTTDGGQSPMANADSLTFWKEVATDYQSFGTVIFELFNEPYGIDTNTWLSGNNQYAGYQQLFDAVRGAGANNLCIVNGLDYGYDLSFVSPSFAVKGANIVYGAHPYNEKGSDDYTGPGGSFANDFKNVVGNFPLIFTEFGVNSATYFPSGYQAVYTRILNYANQQHINYTAFAWWVDTNSPNTFPDVIADWSGTPLNGGVLVHADLQQHPGTPIQ